MFICRLALRSARTLATTSLRRRGCSVLGSSAAWAENDVAKSSWSGVVAEMMQFPLLDHRDFVDFYSCLQDHHLTVDEIELSRTIFCTGPQGDRFARAWLYASIAACWCCAHDKMAKSLIQYFLANEEVRTPANYIGVLRFLADSKDLSQFYAVLKKMRSEMNNVNWEICRRDVKVVLSDLGDWKTLMNIGLMVDDPHEMNSWYVDAFLTCLFQLNLPDCKTVVSNFQSRGAKLRVTILETVVQFFEISASTTRKDVNLYLSFMDLIFKSLGNMMESNISHETALLMSEWFKSLPSPKWLAQTDCFANDRGACSGCGAPLERFLPTREELLTMQTELKDRTFYMERKLYSTKDMLKDFEVFLDRVKPFDMVIDYENLVRLRLVARSPSFLFSIIREIVDFYQPLNILFIGKRITHRDPVMSFFRKAYPKISLHKYTIGRIFKDDAFMLYAAVKFNCYLVSNDGFRDHMALLPTNSKILWRQWKAYRQISISQQGELIYPVDSRAEISGAIEDGRVHFPHYAASDYFTVSEKVEFLCLRRRHAPKLSSKATTKQKRKSFE